VRLLTVQCGTELRLRRVRMLLQGLILRLSGLTLRLIRAVAAVILLCSLHRHLVLWLLLELTSPEMLVGLLRSRRLQLLESTLS